VSPLTLSRLCEQALERARLYEAAQEDIARRKQAEEEISTLNIQLQRAMAETHHRVKNNLQVVASMLDMIIGEETDQIPATVIRHIRLHVETLGKLHDLLTHQIKEERGNEVISGRALLEEVIPLFRQTTGGPKLRFRLEDMPLCQKQATALLLLTNELISNGVKHGHSLVDVSLQVQDATVQLIVTDDVPGFPEGFDPRYAAHTGLELVKSLARWDLRGETHYINQAEGGAEVQILFPMQADAAPM